MLANNIKMSNGKSVIDKYKHILLEYTTLEMQTSQSMAKVVAFPKKGGNSNKRSEGGGVKFSINTV